MWYDAGTSTATAGTTSDITTSSVATERSSPAAPSRRPPPPRPGTTAATIAICLHGLTRERFTKAQYRTLVELATAMDDAYAGMLSFHGHCEVSSKSCPVFPYRAVLGLDSHGAMAFHPTDSPGFADAPLATDDAASSPPTLRITSKHPQVTTMQHLLSGAGHPLEEDGLFGTGDPGGGEGVPATARIAAGRNRRSPHMVRAHGRGSRAPSRGNGANVDDLRDPRSADIAVEAHRRQHAPRSRPTPSDMFMFSVIQRSSGKLR